MASGRTFRPFQKLVGTVDHTTLCGNPTLHIGQLQTEAHSLFRRGFTTVCFFSRNREMAQGFREIARLQLTLRLGAMPVAVQRPWLAPPRGYGREGPLTGLE